MGMRKVEITDQKINSLIALDPVEGQVLANTLIDSFLSRGKNDIESAIQLFKKHDYKAAFEIIHKFKATSGSVGAISAMNLSDELQNLLKFASGDNDALIESIFTELRAHVQESSSFILSLKKEVSNDT